jgi:hypothetical protein
MKRHEDIDRRSLAMARLIVERIDLDPERRGFQRARETCARWMDSARCPGVREWSSLLAGSWDQVRGVLLKDDEEGRRLRQCSPFTSVLSPRERWALYRKFAHESKAA